MGPGVVPCRDPSIRRFRTGSISWVGPPRGVHCTASHCESRQSTVDVRDQRPMSETRDGWQGDLTLPVSAAPTRTHGISCDPDWVFRPSADPGAVAGRASSSGFRAGKERALWGRSHHISKAPAKTARERSAQSGNGQNRPKIEVPSPSGNRRGWNSHFGSKLLPCWATSL
jgi:hypothetical protein